MANRKWLLLICVAAIIFSGFACGKRHESGPRNRTEANALSTSPQNRSTGTKRLNYNWTSNRVQCTSGIFCFACGNDGNVFVGCKDGTVSYSADGGKHWKISSVAGKPCFVTTLINFKGAVYAGTGRGVYRSTDNGIHWRAANTGLTDLGVTCLSWDSHGTLYAGVGSGVFRSIDSGNHWKRVFVGLASDGSSYFDSLVIDSRGQMFALSQGGDVYISRKKTWEQLDFRRIRGSITCIRIDSKDRLYVGVDPSAMSGDRPEWTNEEPVMRSDDGGQHWKSLRICKDNVSCNSLAIAGNGTIIAGTNAGIFASCDHGEHWQPSTVDQEILGQPAWLNRCHLIVQCTKEGRIYLLDASEHTLQCGVPIN